MKHLQHGKAIKVLSVNLALHHKNTSISHCWAAASSHTEMPQVLITLTQDLR